MKKIHFLSLAVTLTLFASLANAGSMDGTDYTARIGAPDQGLLLGNRQSDSRLPGISFLRPVLSGVLYRSGVGGSHGGLSKNQLIDLCRAGFSKALIVDFNDGKSARGITRCSNRGEIEYKRVTSRRTANEALKAIYQVIKSGSGPVLAHCRNGVHASNTISAKALVRFCGWSIASAKNYWEKTRNKAPCSPNCKSWIDAKFKGFSAGDGGMPLTDSERRAICP